MPQRTKDAPDDQDVFNMCAALGEEFHVSCSFETHYYADCIQVVCRARLPQNLPNGEVVVQALSKRRYGKHTEVAQVHYLLAFDLWCQLDGGGATAAKRGPAYGWNGRVEVPRRRSV